MQTHIHEQSGEVIEGLQLVPGAIIRPGDHYASSDGRWERFMYGDIVLQQSMVKWVRPRDLSESAREVLQYIVRREAHPKFIHVYNNQFAVTCHYDWQGVNWTHAQRPPSLSSESLQELIDCGYISRLQVFGHVYGITGTGLERAAHLGQQN